MQELESFQPQPTADGSFTFFSTDFGEAFHSHHGARQESFLKFVQPTLLAEKAKKPVVHLLDICYGLGYNTAAALQKIWAINPYCYVEIIGLELNAAVPQAAITYKLFDNWNYDYTEIFTKLAFAYQVNTDRLQAQLLIGDARANITHLQQSGFEADAIFLDPFSPPLCPQLWTVEFIAKVAQCLKVDGLLATYSCAAAVRTALLQAGLQIGSTPPVGRKTGGTVAAHSQAEENAAIAENPPMSSLALPPLSQAEREHLQTRAAIPYRDRCLNDSASAILQRRQQEQQASSLEPTSRWRKRWLSTTKY